MAKKRKKSVSRPKKPASRPGIAIRLFTLFGRMIRWLAAIILRNSRRNPLLAFGLATFLVTFGFVSYNALFRQNGVHRAVFFETRSVEGQNRATSIDALLNENNNITVHSSGGLEQSPATRFDPQIKAMQQKLSELGIYNGPIDGIGGPQTREAIATWQKLEKSLTNGKKSGADDAVRMLIRDSSAARMVDRDSTTASVPQRVRPLAANTAENKFAKSLDGKADVMRVQAALRSFGNSNVMVNGVEDKLTQEAIIQFQKMFGLQESGKIDQLLMDKMREIGLL